MDIRQALAWGREQLSASPTAAGDSRLLLQHVLGVDEPSKLIAHDERELTADELAAYRALVRRAGDQEPVPYLIGEAPFYGLSFRVTPAVLIPRPETELLVKAALDWARERSLRHVVDVGTGSGCIAIVLARHLRQSTKEAAPSVERGPSIEAVDVSEAALQVARENARRHGVERQIRFRHGTLLEAATDRADLVVANLPYIADDEWTALDEGVKWYEPAGALRGGVDGLELIAALLRQARTRLRPQGALFLEIGWRQGEAAADLARSLFPAAHVAVLPDYAGHDRILAVETA
ncbi:MAG: peptide chain release factor N(5)-glutamine methyltransferase [Candidatus Promineifilaceae bacterium]|nr:peptide chain release factor N(5)-glutamine methyltransferase [Candidatus Promineifilaceae bacterium]